MAHSYGLDWIDEDALFRVTEKVFGSAIRKVEDRAGRALPPDPFTVVAQAVLTDAPVADVLEFDRVRAINKTLSNAIGEWHQAVLGIAPNWRSLGANGGGVDIRTREGYLSPKWGKPVFAEVKNRFNTIKASDEKDMWDKLDLLAKANEAVAYLIQIVPRTTERYDRPWKPSGRTERRTVRCCDGATAYDMVFGRAGALRDLYEAFPLVMADVVSGSPELPGSFSADDALRVFSDGLPL